MNARTIAPEPSWQATGPSLTIPDFPLPDRRLCGNTRVRALHLARLRKEQRTWAMYATIVALGGRPAPAWATGPVGVEYDVYRTRAWAARPLDDDNFCMGAKGLRDGIADALGVTDSRWRTVAVRWHKVIGGSGDETGGEDR